MNKVELKEQVNDLHNVLMDLVEFSPNIVKSCIKISTINPIIKVKLENQEALRRLKSMHLENEFVKSCDAFDIHEALKINIIEAKYKLKEFNFSTNEVDTIINKYKGSIGSFLEKYNKI